MKLSDTLYEGGFATTVVNPAVAEFRRATFSADRQYRYSLSRIWNPDIPSVVFIGLNPSTANQKFDDATVRRCVGFARSWGYGGVLVLNLFAFRTKHPAELKSAEKPLEYSKGLNDRWIRRAANNYSVVVAAWGTHGSYRDRGNQIRKMFNGNLYYLKLNKDGSPAHPLYLPSSRFPVLWSS